MEDRDENERQERIRRRAYQLWEQEGRPEGRAEDHWDQATELVAIEDNHRVTLQPVDEATELGPTGEPVEPIEAIENTGEFPTMTDQGEQQIPSREAAEETGRQSQSSPSKRRFFRS
jgi:hypothetical protein